MKNIPPQHKIHQPVLLEAVLDVLSPKPGETYLDLTAGYGGHAEAVIGKVGTARLATLVDRDETAIASLQPLAADGAKLIQSDFLSAAKQLAAKDNSFDLILADLGVSSPQLDIAERGFSFSNNGPLDMRMDQNQVLTAERIVNTWPQAELAELIHKYGEEPITLARRIAKYVCEARPIKDTAGLAQVILSAYHRRGWSKTHPATRTFQALRIAVNDELGQLEQLLPLSLKLLKPGGRVAIISFHSLEDRLVKQFFKEYSSAGYEADLALITKKAIEGKNDLVHHNPRARSAKLRAAVKIKTKGLGYDD